MGTLCSSPGACFGCMEIHRPAYVLLLQSKSFQTLANCGAEPKKVLKPDAFQEFELKEKTIVSHNVAMSVFMIRIIMIKWF